MFSPNKKLECIWIYLEIYSLVKENIKMRYILKKNPEKSVNFIILKMSKLAENTDYFRIHKYRRKRKITDFTNSIKIFLFLRVRILMEPCREEENHK